MSEIASAFVSLVPSARGFGRATESQINGEIGSSGKGIGSRLGSAIKVGLLAGVATVGTAIVAGLKDAAEYEKLQSQTAATLKSTGGAANITAKGIVNLSNEIAGYSDGNDDAVQAGANLLLTFTNIKNGVGKGNDIFNQTTKTLYDMSTALGQDTKSSALQLGKALNDPIKGVTALQRVGVSFTAAQKEQIKALVESGNTMGAQKLILRELNKEFGGSAKALGGTLAGSVGRLKDTFGDLLRDAVTPLVPKLQTAANFLSKNLPGAIATVSAKVKGFVGLVKTQFAKIFGSGGGGSALAGVKGFITAMKANLVPVLQTAANTFKTKVLPTVTALGKYLAAKLVPVFKQFAQFIQNDVLPAVAAIAQFVYGKVYPAVIDLAKSIGKNLQPIFEALVETVQKYIIPTLQKVIEKFRENAPLIQRVAGYIGTLIGTALKLAGAILGKVLPPLIRLNGFLFSKVYPVLANVVIIVFKVIDALVNFGKGVVNVAKKVGQFVSGLRDKFGDALDFVKSIPGRMVDALGAIGTLLLKKGIEFIQGLISGITKKTTDVVNFVKGIPGKIGGAVGNLGELLFQKGKDFINGLLRGIVAGFEAVVRYVRGLAAKVKDAFGGQSAAVGPAEQIANDALGNNKQGKKTVGGFSPRTLLRGFTSPTEKRKAEKPLKDFIDKINDLSLKGLKKLQDGLKKQADALGGQFDRIASAARDLASSVADSFRPDLFSGSLGDLFGVGQQSLANLKAVREAQKRLLALKGLSKDFLSSLFQSGNSNLILQLAGSSNSTIRDASTLFTQNSNIADQLGNNLASDRYGAKLDDLRTELQGVNRRLDLLGPRIGREINKAGHDGHKRKAAA